MAQRRMFSIKLIDTAKFLKLPATARLLYFDLGMRADDDGIVEAFNVIRITGGTEDDLRLLEQKGYIKVLNEDLVTYIIDWKDHNKIRADRKVDSIYQDLLKTELPGVEPLCSKDKQNKNSVNQMTTKCQPNDNQMTTKCQPNDSIGQDRLGQDRLGQDSTVQEIERILNVSNQEAILIYNTCKEVNINTNVVDVVKEKIEIIQNGNFNNQMGALIKAIREDWKPSTLKTNGKSKVLHFNDFPHRDTDYEALERRLLGWD